MLLLGLHFFNLSTASGYIWFALIGAALTSFCVYGIASIGPRGITPIKLALAGASISAILSSLVSLIILPRADVMDAYRFWQVGSLSGATWEGIKSVLPFIIVGLIISVIFMHALNALALGDEVATGLGVNTGLVRIMCAIAGVILCGATTAIAGPIGFIGLMIPHIVRLILGSDMKNFNTNVCYRWGNPFDDIRCFRKNNWVTERIRSWNYNSIFRCTNTYYNC